MVIDCNEVLVTACAPEIALGVHHERMANAASKDPRAVGTREDAACPRTLEWALGHEGVNVHDEAFEETGPFGRGGLKSLGDCASEHGVRR